MKTSDILDLDYREDKNKKIIQKCLCKIKPLAKYSSEEQVPLNALEKFVNDMCIRYEVYVQYITPFYIKDNEMRYSVSSKRTDTNEWLPNVYAYCIYELFAKLAIKLYSEIKTECIERRNTNET